MTTTLNTTPATTPATPVTVGACPAVAAARRARLVAMMKTAGSRIFSVTFVKKDGELRTMQVQLPALQKRLVGDDACDAAKRATETRKANNPNLFPVFDVASNGIRSINLDTVQTIKVDGQVFNITT